MVAGYRYSEKQWRDIISSYAHVIKTLGGKATEQNICKKLGITRSRVYSQMRRGEEFGYLTKTKILNGQEIRNNTIWVLTKKGEELLTR